MGLYSKGLIIGRIFASEIWGAYLREGLFLGGLLSEFYGILFHQEPMTHGLLVSQILYTVSTLKQTKWSISYLFSYDPNVCTKGVFSYNMKKNMWFSIPFFFLSWTSDVGAGRIAGAPSHPRLETEPTSDVSLTLLVQLVYPFIVLSLILMNNGTESRTGWTKIRETWENVRPNFVLVLLFVRTTEVESGKGTWLSCERNAVTWQVRYMKYPLVSMVIPLVKYTTGSF